MRINAISTVTPTFPQTVIDMPLLSTDATNAVAAPRADLQGVDRRTRRTRRRASTPPTSAWPRSTTCRPRSSWTGSRTSQLCKRGEAEALLRAGDTTIGGRIPVNPSGGLACFGEAVPAQALAQVCEVTWQLRGQATGRQVEGARVGITANQGLFGHGSSVILSR